MATCVLFNTTTQRVYGRKRNVVMYLQPVFSYLCVFVSVPVTVRACMRTHMHIFWLCVRVCVSVCEKEWVLGQSEVTGGRRLSAFHGSLGTDCGEDSQERAVRGRENDRVRKGEWEGRLQYMRNAIFLYLCFDFGHVPAYLFYLCVWIFCTNQLICFYSLVV